MVKLYSKQNKTSLDSIPDYRKVILLVLLAVLSFMMEKQTSHCLYMIPLFLASYWYGLLIGVVLAILGASADLFIGTIIFSQVPWMQVIMSLIVYVFFVVLSSYFADREKVLVEYGIKDYLTQFYNFSFLTEYLQQHIANIKDKENAVFSIAILDIDNFKKINDTCGHSTGNIILNMLAGIIKRNTRNSDILARYGGDEICIVLPNAGQHQAIEAMERVRKAVCTCDMVNNTVTISVGVATYPTDGNCMQKLMESADKALYRAKNTTKNRVVAFGNIQKSEDVVLCSHGREEDQRVSAI